MDALLQQNKQLRLRIEQTEKENKDLKKSLYDLALQHHTLVLELGKYLPPGKKITVQMLAHHTVPFKP
jgi:hypothetical protein